jgi:hypothetical protein
MNHWDAVVLWYRVLNSIPAKKFIPRRVEFLFPLKSFWDNTYGVASEGL